VVYVEVGQGVKSFSTLACPIMESCLAYDTSPEHTVVVFPLS